jgi:molybdopterin-biosynthesis enzyme MoeA-like protein
MQVMMDEVMPRLAKGRPMSARTVRVDAAEGDVAPPLAALQAAHPDVQMGSYPFFEHRRFGTYVVLRGTDDARLDSALADLWEVIAEHGFSASAGDGSLGQAHRAALTLADG